MAQHRSFGVAKTEHLEEPIPFDIAGEEFAVPMPFPAMAILDLAEKAMTVDPTLGDTEALRTAMEAFSGFLQTALGDDYPRFKAASYRARLDLPEFMELCQWLMSEITGRPTTPPSSSPEPPSEPSTSSTAADSPQVPHPSFI